MVPTRLSIVLFFATACCAACAPTVEVRSQAMSSVSQTASVEEPISAWIADLDSASWRVRESAMLALRNCATSNQNSVELLHLLRQELARPDLSYEAQKSMETLERLLLAKMRESGDLDSVEQIAAPRVSGSSPDVDLEALLSNNPAQRVAAQRRLLESLESPRGAYVAMIKLRLLLKNGVELPDDVQRLRALERIARRRWLELPDTPENALRCSTKQLEGWVARVAQTPMEEERLDEWRDLEGKLAVSCVVPPGNNALANDDCFFSPKTHRDDLAVWSSVRFLEDALACEKTASAARRAIEKRLARRANSPSGALTPAGEILLRYLLFLGRPCLAAEYWLEGRHCSSQILALGLAQHHDEATHSDVPTHFDDLGDGVVRCVSGRNLKPGLHPLFKAIAHPQDKAFFQLVELRSARQKLLYPLETESSGTNQDPLLAVSKRTLAESREENRLLTLDELILLPRLHPQAVSCHAGWLLETFDDVPLLPPNPPQEEVGDSSHIPTFETSFSPALMTPSATLPPSHHSSLCLILIDIGTKECAPALLRAMDQDKVRCTNSLRNVRIAHIAAFSVCMRDPWEGADAWLLALLNDNRPLISPVDTRRPSPMLRSRRKESPNWAFMSTTATPETSTHETNPADIESNGPNISGMAAGILCQKYNLPPSRYHLVEILEVPVGFERVPFRWMEFEDAKSAKRGIALLKQDILEIGTEKNP
ncbi:MAG: hypothetical protein Q4D38_08190 [Planctomycetia bacterium]|nr:hypothetical protein [Planctomycetia bacterium]